MKTKIDQLEGAEEETYQQQKQETEDEKEKMRKRKKRKVKIAKMCKSYLRDGILIFRSKIKPFKENAQIQMNAFMLIIPWIWI